MKIKRSSCPPTVFLEGYNLQDEVLRFQDLPVPNPSDKDHYLSATKAREYIDTNKTSFKTLKQFIPTTKADTDEQKAVKHAKSLDQGRSFTATKVRATVSCDSCGADRVIFF